MHDFEDRSFRFHREEYSLCLYGVFDGFQVGSIHPWSIPKCSPMFQGAHVADYIMKRLPAEVRSLGLVNPVIISCD